MKRFGKILIIENDLAAVRIIRTHLEMEGFEVHVLKSGAEVLERYFNSKFNLVIMDWKLKKLPGIEICRQIRLFDQYTPIVILDTRIDKKDAVQAFEAGCDDYITSPFSVRELSARVKAILRRYKCAKQMTYGKISERRIEVNGLVIDPKIRRVSIRGTAVNLTAKEYDILCLLASNPGMVYSRRLLLDLLWDHDADIYEHAVNSHINRLRGKIEKNPGNPKYILTEWGVGYRFTDYGN